MRPFIELSTTSYEPSARSRGRRASTGMISPWSNLKKLPDRLEVIDILQNIEGSPALPLRDWSQDESRLGLKTITRSVLTALGVKPRGPIQWTYQSFY